MQRCLFLVLPLAFLSDRTFISVLLCPHLPLLWWRWTGLLASLCPPDYSSFLFFCPYSFDIVLHDDMEGLSWSWIKKKKFLRRFCCGGFLTRNVFRASSDPGFHLLLLKLHSPQEGKWGKITVLITRGIFKTFCCILLSVLLIVSLANCTQSTKYCVYPKRYGIDQQLPDLKVGP